MPPKPEAKPTHTPTPWRISECTNGDIYIGGHEWAAKMVDKVDFTTMPKEANAAFIVRAVNAHEELVQTAKEMQVELKKLGVGALTWDRRIAKAEGKE